MKNKLRTSLSIKFFIGTVFVLVICSAFVYAIMMLSIPKTYQKNVNVQVQRNTDDFVEKLSSMTLEEAKEPIYNFCIENVVLAKLDTADGQKFSFGDMDKIKETTEDELNSLAYGVQFKNSTQEDMLVFFVVDSSGRQNVTLSFWKSIPLVLILVLLASFITAYLCHRILIRPIIYLSRVSKRLSTLDLTWRCNTKRKDELGILAESLDSMSLNLQRTLKELEMKSEQLEQDIVKMKDMERQRKSFFAAVSHELKTPITILKAYSENMLYKIGDFADREKYLRENLTVLNSLEKLVKEIILVAKLDANDMQQSYEEASLVRMIKSDIKSISPIAKKKQIQIKNQIDTDIKIYVNERLFKKVLSNIILNAVQYSPPQEQVILKLENEKRLQIINTGTRIENLEDIFQPFFRVEKSRNKATGGSGMGLYIVKKVLELHGMDYQMKNIEGGVMFEITLDRECQKNPLLAGNNPAVVGAGPDLEM